MLAALKATFPPMNKVPAHHAFFNQILDALRELGGSGSIEEINATVVNSLHLSNDILEKLHNPAEGSETEIEYRLAWTRTYLKKFGLIENSTRGVWALTEKAKQVGKVDPDEVLKYVRGLSKKQKNGKLDLDETHETEDTKTPDWKTQLHLLLTQELEPAAFERLVQRILRESGFIQVEVLGRTGDGGIDGKGIARIHGLMSFHVVFQCKRYTGSVSSSEIRDFRGAMVGRSDKGLFITTGTFSKDAMKEATRDGAPPIDLLDGEQLADKLKELKLGIEIEMVERVTVQSEWFRTI